MYRYRLQLFWFDIFWLIHFQFSSNKTDLPVMVFFHGGGFQCGSGIRPFYGPDHLLDHDVSREEMNVIIVYFHDKSNTGHLHWSKLSTRSAWFSQY